MVVILFLINIEQYLGSIEKTRFYFKVKHRKWRKIFNLMRRAGASFK